MAAGGAHWQVEGKRREELGNEFFPEKLGLERLEGDALRVVSRNLQLRFYVKKELCESPCIIIVHYPGREGSGEGNADATRGPLTAQPPDCHAGAVTGRREAACGVPGRAWEAQERAPRGWPSEKPFRSTGPAHFSQHLHSLLRLSASTRATRVDGNARKAFGCQHHNQIMPGLELLRNDDALCPEVLQVK